MNTSMNKPAFGKRLNQARLEQNYTAEMLAEECDMNSVFLRQIEGGAKSPSLKNLVKLCNALQVSPSFLLKESLTVKTDEIEFVIDQLSALSPKQTDVVLPTLKALIENLD